MLDFSQMKSATVQIFLTFELPLWLYLPLIFVVIPIITNTVITKVIKSKHLNKKQTEREILGLNVFGTFIITFALGANSGIKFGDLPSTVSLFNPLLGFYPIYIAYLLKKAIYEKRIK